MTFFSETKYGFIKREYVNGRITVGSIAPYPPDADNKTSDEYSWTEHIFVFPTQEEAEASHTQEVSKAAAMNSQDHKKALSH